MSSSCGTLSVRTLHILGGYSAAVFNLDTAVWILVGHLRMCKLVVVALEWGEHVALKKEKPFPITYFLLKSLKVVVI